MRCGRGRRNMCILLILTRRCFLSQLTFILWTLTFCNEALDKFVESNALDVLVQLVTAAPREKVVRVALEALQVRRSCGSASSLCGLTEGRGVVNENWFRICSAR